LLLDFAQFDVRTLKMVRKPAKSRRRYGPVVYPLICEGRRHLTIGEKPNHQSLNSERTNQISSVEH
jgi:hypothetical protein